MDVLGKGSGVRVRWMARSVVALLFLLQIGYAALPVTGAGAAGAKSIGERFVTAGSRFQSETGYKIKERRCPKTGPIGETEGDTYACGTLLVPENYDEPEGRQIAITFELFVSTSLSPAPDPVVYLEGGPGGSAIDRGALWGQVFANLRATRDVIIFDQRGTKYSGRLDCSPYLVALDYLIRTDPETQEIFEQIAEEDGDAALSAAQVQVYYSACASGLADNGVDLGQYNSAVSARDVENLMGALGYDEFNLYGISYGTRLALTMMRDRPEKLRSVVLDSSYPPQVDGYEVGSAQLEMAVSRLISNCEAQRRCNRAFPDLDERLDEVLANVSKDEFALDLLIAVLGQINSDPRVPPYIPRMIYELSEGSTVTLEGIISGDIFETEAEELPVLTEAEELLLTAQELEQDAIDILAAAAEEEQAQRPGAIWFTALTDAIGRITDEEDRVYALLGTLLLPALTAEPDAGLLEELVTGLLPADEQQPLLESLDELKEDEIQFVFDLIADTSEVITDRSLTDGMYYAVECFEEMPFNNEAEAREVIDDLRYPALAVDAEAFLEQNLAICSVFPTGEADRIETAPVESDVPTLVLAGEYDTQTPFSWGEVATEGLTNAHLVEFPNTGHGAVIFSQCARDIGEAFINNPNAAPLSECTEDLTTRFVTTSA